MSTRIHEPARDALGSMKRSHATLDAEMNEMKIKVMPDYHCWPLWHYESDTVGPIEPRSLPVSYSLASQLEKWAEQYDHTLNQECPPGSKFATPEAETDFIRCGKDLATRLKSELNCGVLYFDISTGETTSI